MNESTARNIRVQDRYDELMRIGRHGHYETMFQVVREEIESLRQQLASCDAEIERLKTVPMRYRRMAFNAQLQDENAQLSQQLADSQKQVTLLREAMQGAWKDGYCFVGPEGQTDEQKAFEQALAATGQAMSRYILCEREPIAWKCEQEHFDSMGGISTEYMSHKIECVDRSHWVPLYAATAPKEQ